MSVFQPRKPAVAKICFIAMGTRVVGSGHAQCSHKTGLCELGFLLLRSLFKHLIQIETYRLMSINLCPGIHCKANVRVGIEKELGRRCNKIRNNPVRSSNYSIRLHLTST